MVFLGLSVTGCMVGNQDRPSEPALTRPTPSSQQSSCAGSAVATISVKVRGQTQEEYAKRFAKLLKLKDGRVRRVSTCSLVLEPSGTVLNFGAPIEAQGPALQRASSFSKDAPDVPLSLQVVAGRVDAITAARCGRCTRVEARVIAQEGATPAKIQSVRGPVIVDSPDGWTRRGLLLRFLQAQGDKTMGTLLVALEDGDFAAG